jgi:hypothetical protein
MSGRRALELYALLAIGGSGCVTEDVIGTSTYEVVVVNDDRYELIQEVVFDNPQAAHYNPVDDRVYVGRRGTTTDGLYRIDLDGTSLRIGPAANPAGVVVNAIDGTIYFSEDVPGIVWRKLLGDTNATTRQRWVSDFPSGPIEGTIPDDDPIGIAIAPSDYVGPLLAPGQALIVDRGSGGPDDLFGFSTTTLGGSRLLRPDDGGFEDGVDVAVSQTAIHLVDAIGRLFEVGAGGALTQIAVDPPLVQPLGVANDPLTGGLLVIDASLDAVLSIDLVTGAASEVVDGFSFNAVNWAGIDTSPDGAYMFVTDAGADRVYVFARDFNEQPVAVCAPQIVVADAACLATANVDGGSSDPDGDELTIVQSPAGPYGLGVTDVTLTVTDPDGSQSDCSTTVTVQDAIAPVVTCNAPPEIEMMAVPVSFSAIATDNCGAAASVVAGASCEDPTTDTCRPGGECTIETATETATIDATGGVDTVFTWTASATDGSGNTASVSCQTTVVAPPGGVPTCNQPPVALCAPRMVSADAACQGLASVDAGSGDPDGDPVMIVQQPAGPYPLGDTLVTLIVTDPEGAQGACSTTVTVRDVTAPVLSCNAPASIEMNAVPASFTATVSDNCGAGAPVVAMTVCVDPTDGTCRPGGDCAIGAAGSTATITSTGGVGTVFTWQTSASDVYGNSASRGCEVTVAAPPGGVPSCDDDDDDDDSDSDSDGHEDHRCDPGRSRTGEPDWDRFWVRVVEKLLERLRDRGWKRR